jgi:hypothetical protein
VAAIECGAKTAMRKMQPTMERSHHPDSPRFEICDVCIKMFAV